MTAPISAPGLKLPDTGWTNDPVPGLYWVRFFNTDDNTYSQPAFCIVTPTGPTQTHALWAWTPNIGADGEKHESGYNYFVDPKAPVEYLPYNEDILVSDDDGKLTRKCVAFEVFPRVVGPARE
jgi:hypothetical protein